MYPKQSEIDYMIRRSLTILLSDLRVWKRSLHELSFGIAPINSQKKEELDLLLPELVLLFNLWKCSRFLRETIDSIKIPREWHFDTEIVPQNSFHKNIDWGKTFKHRLSGGKEFIARNFSRRMSDSHARYITLVLGEFLIHCEVIIDRIELSLKSDLQEYISRAVKDILEIKDSVELLIQGDLHIVYESCKNQLQRAKEILNKVLSKYASVGATNEIFLEYDSSVKIKKPKGTYTPNVTKLLYKWRQDYMCCCSGLCNEKYFVFERRGNPAELYEIWCFYEICLALKQMGEKDIVQLCILNRKQNIPQFRLGSRSYVYFDYHSEAFIPIENNEITTAMPGFFVEWFIRNIEDYKESICIDSKYAEWESREVLKILGYMVNFGIRNGAMIIRDKIRKESIGGEEITSGLFKISFPHHNNEKLWILSLIPNKENEKINNEVLKNFVIQNFF